MIKRFWGYLVSLKKRLPLLYSLVLITFIPLTLVINTWWNLQAFERDTNFAVREQALAMEKTFIALLQSYPFTDETLQKVIGQLHEKEPTLVQATILRYTNEGKFTVVATSNPQLSHQDEDVFLNNLSWFEDKSYFTKTYDATSGNTLWMVITPFTDTQGKKVGLVNFKVSTATVDKVVDRTSRDALIILGISVVGVVLLLINHLRFFERSLLVERLQQVDKMKDDFISVASHELRTPLTAIKSCISMIKEDFKEKIPADLNEWFDIIDISVARLNDLVSDLLNVSRIEQNRLDFSLAAVDSTKMLEEILNQLKFSAEEKGLNLRNLSAGKPFQVMAHADRLREVLINLIGNAIKYTPKGEVTIQQVVDGNTVRIMVKDTGIGIAPEDKEKLFQKFSRITTDKTREIPGTGLGLWITKSLVERMKGKIYADSIVGQGTVFTVVLQKANT